MCVCVCVMRAFEEEGLGFCSSRSFGLAFSLRSRVGRVHGLGYLLTLRAKYCPSRSQIPSPRRKVSRVYIGFWAPSTGSIKS